MSKASRDKGKRGERSAKALLIARDYTILADTTAGLSTDDLVVQSPGGEILSVEVKNCKLINIPVFVKQAKTNAKKNHYLLMCHISGTSAWLIMGSNRVPVIWHQNTEV